MIFVSAGGAAQHGVSIASMQQHGCINCHGMYAASTDLDFQLTNAYPRRPGRFIDLLKVPGAILPKGQ